jgi:6-phosphogluconolactonase
MPVPLPRIRAVKLVLAFVAGFLLLAANAMASNGVQGTIVVSEAGASSVWSYRLDRDGSLNTLTSSLLVGQGAACWVAVSPNGCFAYTGNAAGGISGFAIGRDGRLTALGAPTLMPSPRDLDFDESGRFLNAISSAGQVTTYRVGNDGSLTAAGSAPAAAGITGAAAL